MSGQVVLLAVFSSNIISDIIISACRKQRLVIDFDSFITIRKDEKNNPPNAFTITLLAVLPFLIHLPPDKMMRLIMSGTVPVSCLPHKPAFTSAKLKWNQSESRLTLMVKRNLCVQCVHVQMNIHEDPRANQTVFHGFRFNLMGCAMPWI